ncbi:sugar phosphate isomerase/epimerase [Akkermansiaceae bacterium]|jgi:sugar phosphate isomerase/epimerase|nr:sugar phosphate isomerase/epimerase [Akkermansiaceae bacterium]MDA7930323.1 sugar phosphate isomerase/epimerase [Akkermansiaceae bacterium]MDB4680879.1 sugar phosphate isomerase/epimerase [Akkermansiaceae bacterium]MDF1712907.1 sugar phosphate isomerase/epimerase [Akkermansiaceae bacterium]
MNRRDFSKIVGAAALVRSAKGAEQEWALRYVMSSAMYGNMLLDEVLAEVEKTGSESIDIWRKVHATHREQISKVGDEAFQKLLEKHQTKMSVSTCYPLGPFRQDDEMRWTKKNGGTMTVCGSGGMGPKDPVGKEARKQVKAFFEKLKPHYELAEELGVTMAIENHKNSMLSSPDSIRYFYELNPSKNVGVALAPHHLNDTIDQIPALLREGGNRHIPFIYFQEHHPSSKKKMSEEDQLKQLPGFGKLDYVPILRALRDIKFSGLVEIFGHPVPRGIPMLGSAVEITKAINTSRAYLDHCLRK